MHKCVENHSIRHLRINTPDEGLGKYDGVDYGIDSYVSGSLIIKKIHFYFR